MKPGTKALPVPGFHSAEVSTYPLMVVAESAVIIELAFSSACIIDGRLTRPTAAKPNVHLFTFIYCSFHLFFCFVFYSKRGRRPSLRWCNRSSAAQNVTTAAKHSATRQNRPSGPRLVHECR